MARKRRSNWERYNGSERPEYASWDLALFYLDLQYNISNALMETPLGHSGVGQLWEPQKEEILSKRVKPSRKRKHQEQRCAGKLTVQRITFVGEKNVKENRK